MLFTDLIKAYILELPKMPHEDDGTLPWAWGKLLKTNTVEDLDKLAKSHKELSMAVSAVKFHGPIEILRWWWEEKERVRRDMEGIKGAVREDAVLEIAQRMKAKGYSSEEILELTSLSPEQIAKL